MRGAPLMLLVTSFSTYNGCTAFSDCRVVSKLQFVGNHSAFALKVGQKASDSQGLVQGRILRIQQVCPATLSEACCTRN
jgi:hypothetical protein